MQLSPNIPDNITIVIIQLQSILCAVIKRGTHKKFVLSHVYTTSYNALIASSGVLINTTFIGSSINNFLKTYKLNNSPLAIICDDTIIPQGYASTVEASAYEYLSKYLAVPHHALSTIYLCPHEEKFLSWWGRMPYTLLLQLQLIAYTYHLNIISVNTKLPVLLEAYKCMYGHNFRPLQLAVDLQRAHYDLAATIHFSVVQQFFEAAGRYAIAPHLYATILGVALSAEDAAWQK
jgi:hypothetical protein